jgi:hypothetical protein
VLPIHHIELPARFSASSEEFHAKSEADAQIRRFVVQPIHSQRWRQLDFITFAGVDIYAAAKPEARAAGLAAP